MPTAELHGAFAWDCDDCGRENFVRVPTGNVDEAAFHNPDNVIAQDFAAVDHEWDAETEAFIAAAMVSRVLITPKTVECGHCGAEFETDLYAETTE